jgi:hypothetical protein
MVWGWGGYRGAATANVCGRWGNTVYAGTRAAWENPYTHNIGTVARGSSYNPVTEATGVRAVTAGSGASRKSVGKADLHVPLAVELARETKVDQVQPHHDMGAW